MSKAKLTVRAKAHQFEGIVIRFAVDENEVWQNVAVAVVAPFAGKPMVDISVR